MTKASKESKRNGENPAPYRSSWILLDPLDPFEFFWIPGSNRIYFFPLVQTKGVTSGASLISEN